MSLDVIIVEDNEEDLREVSNCLADANVCEPENVCSAATYDEACELISDRAIHTDVVLLDLNIPRNSTDSRPEKGHGKRVLDHVHELNKQARVHVQVIIVSAEELADDFEKDLMMRVYKGTLVGSARKDSLPVMPRSGCGVW